MGGDIEALLLLLLLLPLFPTNDGEMLLLVCGDRRPAPGEGAGGKSARVALLVPLV